MLTLLIIVIVIVIPLLFLVSFGWAPQQHDRKRPVEEDKTPLPQRYLMDEEPDDSPHE